MKEEYSTVINLIILLSTTMGSTGLYDAERLLPTAASLHLYEIEVALLHLRLLLPCQHGSISLPVDLARFAVPLHSGVLCRTRTLGLERGDMEEQSSLSFPRKGHFDLHPPLPTLCLYDDSTFHAKGNRREALPCDEGSAHVEQLDRLHLQSGLLLRLAMGLLRLHQRAEGAQNRIRGADQFLFDPQQGQRSGCKSAG